MNLTLRLLAEDIRTTLNGGGPLSDDNNLSERQVMLWIATAIAEQYKLATAEYRAKGENVPDSWWSSVTLNLTLVDERLTNAPRWWATAKLPNLFAPVDTQPLLRFVEVQSEGVPFTAHPIQSAFDRSAGIGYGRFGSAVACYSIHGSLLRLSVPLDRPMPDSISFDAVVMPDLNTITEHPDDPLTIPTEWLPAIRRATLQLAGMADRTTTDQTNNGAADKLPAKP